ncbi:MAG: hypothetical protein Q9219_007398, partial [cf. Caloplaca sp. 3 TL-2023]
LYALADQARAKLVRHVRLPDHDLRVLVAHARLYDNLDECVETMRIQRKRSSTKDPPKYQASSSTDVKVMSQPIQRLLQEDDGVEDASGQVSHAKVERSAECAIFEDDWEDSLSDDAKIIANNSPEPCNHDRPGNGIHGSPIVLEESARFEIVDSSNRSALPESNPGTTVSEIPVDSDSNSDSDSGSDSNSASDSSDLEFETTKKSHYIDLKATAMTISRPKNPRAFLHQSTEPDIAPKLSSSQSGLPNSDQFLEQARSPAAPYPPNQTTPQSTKPSLFLETSLSKSLPSSPQLCNRDIRVLTCARHDLRLERMLHQLRQSSSKSPSHRNTLSRFRDWLSFFGYQTPALDSCELINDIHDEKIL